MKKYNQHYVPQSILRNFANGREAVFCWMKDNNKILENNIKNICAEKSFYNFLLDTGEEIDYDKAIFDNIDGGIVSVITKIINAGKIDVLTIDDRKILAVYVVFQYMRTPAVKNIALSLAKNEKCARQLQGLNLIDVRYIQKIAENISSFKLELVKPTSGVNFIISDCPVLWSPTAEGIYFPISPDYCLCYQKGEPEYLDSICINELEYLASVRFNVAKEKNFRRYSQQ